MHPSSIENMHKAKVLCVNLPPKPVVLDVGGRNNSAKERSYKEVWPEAEHYWVADIEAGRNVTHLMPGPYQIPIRSETVDLVVSGQTLEHVDNPFRLFGDMYRVLKGGGYMILIAPSAGPWHGGKDCWRFGPDSFHALAFGWRMVPIGDWIFTGDSGGGRGRKWDDHVYVGRKDWR